MKPSLELPGLKPPLEIPALKYNEEGLLPAIVQQYDTGEVLMIVWMNDASILLTINTGTLWFWSRSRKRYWNKGAKNDNHKRLIDMSYDCGGGSVLVAVDAPGSQCHTNNRSCFYRSFFRTERLQESGPALIAPQTFEKSGNHPGDASAGESTPDAGS